MSRSRWRRKVYETCSRTGVVRRWRAISNTEGRVGLLTESEYRNSGIETFEEHTIPWIADNFSDAEKVFTDVRTWYPFSVTIENALHGRVFKRKAERYDTFFVFSQDRMKFDPSEVSARVVPYIHDILPVTTMYKRHCTDSLVDRLSGYLSTVTAVRYMKFIAKCDTVICASQHTKRELEKRTSFNGDAHVIYQGVDHLPKVEKKDRDIDLLYVGSTIERKNPWFMKKCLQRAVDQGYSVVTVNFEENDLPGETFTDVTDKELAEIYSRSRYYLHPSLAEGFGRGPVEAQRYGAIPLGLDTPINHEILGENGVSWKQVDTVSDVLAQLSVGISDSTCRAALENSERFKWCNTRRKMADVLVKNGSELVDEGSDFVVRTKHRESSGGEGVEAVHK